MYNNVTVENAEKKDSGTVPASTTAIGSYESKEKAELLERFFGDWIWRAVECLVELEDFNPSPRWISNRLGISVEQAVDAIDGLLVLGLIRRDQDGGYVKDADTKIPKKDYTKEEFNKLISDYFIMSNQINSRMKVSKYNDTFMRHLILAGSRLEVDKCIRKIRQAIEELKDANSVSAPDIDIFGATIGFVSLTEDKDA